MSGISRVGSSTKRVDFMLRALEDTEGMSAPQQANYWLESIAKKVHRGPKVDTWTSARDRAAKAAGIKPTMAKRIWQRWQEMKFVDGESLIALMKAYETICVANEVAADTYRAERLEMRRADEEADKEPA